MANLQQIKEQVEAQEQPVEIPIFQPNDEPYLAPDGGTCTISVLGSESKKYRQAEDVTLRKLIRNQRRKMTPEDVREGQVYKAAAVVTAFHGWEASTGVPLEFNRENVTGLLSVAHILAQVEAGISAHADFSRSASST